MPNIETLMIDNGQQSTANKEEEEAIEIKVQSKEEEILRKLGVLHLENKVTRPKYNTDETDETILKQAGIYYVNTEEYKENAKREVNNNAENKKRIASKLLGEKKVLSSNEAQILRSAGVMMDNMTVVKGTNDISGGGGSSSGWGRRLEAACEVEGSSRIPAPELKAARTCSQRRRHEADEQRAGHVTVGPRRIEK